MQQGRRSASMKASYEALQQFAQSTDVGVLSLTPSLTSQTPETAPASATTQTKKTKKRRETIVEQPVVVPSPAEGAAEEAMETEEFVEGEWVPDPNEPRYCLCNQVSYGDMVACDNPEVFYASNFIFFFIYSNVVFSISVHTSGSTTHASTSRHHRKANGTVPVVRHQ